MYDKCYYVYIIMNKMRTVNYTGMTSDLPGRIWQHKTKYYPKSFSAKYNVNKLVYYELCETADSAITREKQLKGWSKDKKMKLIETINPYYKDLYKDILD